MKTATETLMEDRELEISENRLNSIIRDFIKRFEPEERRDRLDFEMHLHSIVRETYRQAQEPFVKATSHAMAFQMPSPIFVPKSNS